MSMDLCPSRRPDRWSRPEVEKDARHAPVRHERIEITTVRFGSWQPAGWVGFGWAPRTTPIVRAIEHAVSGGVNWIDTAAIYGSVTRRKWLARSGGIPAATGRWCSPNAAWTRPGRFLQAADPQSHPASSDRSGAPLRRLGVERIDLFQIHWPTRPVYSGGSWGEMSRLVDEGKVGRSAQHFGGRASGSLQRVRHVALQPVLTDPSGSGGTVIPWAALTAPESSSTAPWRRAS